MIFSNSLFNCISLSLNWIGAGFLGVVRLDTVGGVGGVGFFFVFGRGGGVFVLGFDTPLAGGFLIAASNPPLAGAFDVFGLGVARAGRGVDPRAAPRAAPRAGLGLGVARAGVWVAGRARAAAIPGGGRGVARAGRARATTMPGGGRGAGLAAPRAPLAPPRAPLAPLAPRAIPGGGGIFFSIDGRCTVGLMIEIIRGKHQDSTTPNRKYDG